MCSAPRKHPDEGSAVYIKPQTRIPAAIPGLDSRELQGRGSAQFLEASEAGGTASFPAEAAALRGVVVMAGRSSPELAPAARPVGASSAGPRWSSPPIPREPCLGGARGSPGAPRRGSSVPREQGSLALETRRTNILGPGQGQPGHRATGGSGAPIVCTCYYCIRRSTQSAAARPFLAATRAPSAAQGTFRRRLVVVKQPAGPLGSTAAG
ncbi:hypothetical protein BDY21DRAFT_420359 [Lineolata rhizophorae]|uniref:Uncharacterized protein n=1 Tax=Lineolata rhizophorae TaxID=578093 RepID=A0A6A6P5U4_9PEZI|nr:hypothetical protein BDY21DRAFT_420359 [Lineolata rhizophorae]